MRKSVEHIIVVVVLLALSIYANALTKEQLNTALTESEVTLSGISAVTGATGDILTLSAGLNSALTTSMQESNLAAFTSSVFDGSGNCSMDELYLMLEITSASGLGIEGHYVLNYLKNATGDAYNFDRLWDAETDAISLENKNGKKLYFTGTVQNAAGRATAYDGTDLEDFTHEGFIYIEGNDYETVDVYLHNYRVLSVQNRDWRMTFGFVIAGCTDFEPNLGNSIFSLFGGSILRGMGSPFAIGNASFYGETDSPLKIKFHVKGNNLLQGGAVSKYSQESMDYISGMDCLSSLANSIFRMSMSQLTSLFNNMLTMTASAIAVRPTGTADATNFQSRACVNLLFDDFWTDGVRTNGKLDLPVGTANPGAPSIDYGNSLGKVIIDGGRYKMHTPGNDNLFYVCNMAICHRKVDMGDEFLSVPGRRPPVFAGVGASVGTGQGGDSQIENNHYLNVEIYNGTFETYDAREYKDVVDVKARGWYRDYHDLRLPYNSRIYGGQFLNCDVYRCNYAVEKGNTPIYVTDEGNEDVVHHDTIPLCRDAFNVRTLVGEGEMITTGPDGTLVIAKEDNPSDYRELTEATLTDEGATNKSYQYGLAKLEPYEEDPDYVTVMIYQPSVYCTTHIDETYITNYVSLIPELGAKLGAINMTLGGDVEIKNRYQEIQEAKTGYLLNTQLNPYTMNYGKVDMGMTPVTLYDVLLDKTQDINHLPSGEAITKNNVDYTISYGLYHMQSFKGNQWALVSLPFDVDTVYVMETSAESGSNSWTDEQWEQYYQRQGEADGNVLSRLLSSLFPSIASKAGSGVLQPFVDLAKDQGKAQLFPLIHYNPDLEGYSADDAHYYLYEMQNDGSANLPDVQAWNKKSQWREFSNTDHWLPAYYTDPATAYTDQDGQPVNTRVLMKKGVTYALYLPQGGDRYWDYKYLIFQGRGPQEIQGHRLTDFNSGNPYSVIDDLQYAKDKGEDLILIQGNNTFSIDTLTNISATTPVYLATPKLPMSFIFEPYTEPTLNILPGEVFAASAGEILKSEMPHHVDQAELTAGSEDMLPHVGNVTLRAWDDNGIVLLSQTEQLVTVYTADGRQLWTKQMRDGEICHVPAGSGIYLLHAGNQSAKLWIK